MNPERISCRPDAPLHVLMNAGSGSLDESHPDELRAALQASPAGRPARPEFLLQPGELIQACEGLRVVAYEDGFLPEPARFVQRIAAVRELPPSGAPSRHLLPVAAS